MENRDLDYTDAAAAEWSRLVPDVAIATIGVTIRVRRAAAILTDVIADVVTANGLSALGDYEVLSAVRRSRTGLTPSELANRLMVSRGAITGRLERLETLGLIHRSVDAADRRSFHVRTTRKGRRVADRILLASQARQQAIIDELPSRDRLHLESGLRALMLVLDDRPAVAADG